MSDYIRDPVRPTKPTPGNWNSNAITAAWLGHATVLINFYGATILTDPVLFSKIGADLGLFTVGRKRVVQSALTAEELPKIDLVILSHAHMDHMDFKSLKALGSHPEVVTSAKTKELLQPLGFKAVSELKWNEKARIKTASGDLEVEAFEVKHWGARWKSDTFRGYNGYLIRKDGKQIMFGGDTAMTSSFKELNRGKSQLAIMPIGSYGRSTESHCTPEEAVQMANEGRAEYIIPVHHSTFPIGKEPLAEPMERLSGSLEKERIAIRKIGQTFQLV
ncbi:MAG: MBL fold metallo-hydrolase [Verrucomicrobiales bacterium]